MIRGSIEVADGSVVQGWIYSPIKQLHGQKLLAFIDSKCVGAGIVSIYRKDLHEAGLGDGFSGFRFSTTLPPGASPIQLCIKLDGSDALIIQTGARVTA